MVRDPVLSLQNHDSSISTGGVTSHPWLALPVSPEYLGTGVSAQPVGAGGAGEGRGGPSGRGAAAQGEWTLGEGRRWAGSRVSP